MYCFLGEKDMRVLSRVGKEGDAWTVVPRPGHMTGLSGEICSEEQQIHTAQDLIGSKLVSWKCLGTMVTYSFTMIYKVRF